MKKRLGWLAILLISFAPVFLWLLLKPEPEIASFSAITQALGELSGLVGMTMFALTFLLSTRITFFEDIFGGLDKVYLAHGVLGGTALIITLTHPLLLIAKFIPQDIQRAADYLLPSQHWSVNFGFLALFGLLLLIIITLFGHIKYHIWKFSHEFLGLMFLLAVLHIFLVRGDASQDIIFAGYYVYATAVSLIGLAGFGYSLLLKNRSSKAARYHIASIAKQGSDTYKITLIPEHKPLAYRAGQFIYVRFYNQRLSHEEHPFSIASASDAMAIVIYVKKMGDYTNKLRNLKVGDLVSIEGPYGRFHFMSNGRSQIWIGGGIGVTPFIGMAKDTLVKASRSDAQTIDIEMYYSCHDKKDFVGLTDLDQIAKSNPHFKVMPWLSNQKGHLSANVIAKYSGPLADKEIYISGPRLFKQAIIQGLQKGGAIKKQIHTEEFELK